MCRVVPSECEESSTSRVIPSECEGSPAMDALKFLAPDQVRGRLFGSE